MNFLNLILWERNYIDLWAIDHVLTGAFFGVFVLLFGWRFSRVFMIFLFSIILWEFSERLFSVNELLINSVLDVAIGASGFLLGYYLIKKMNYERKKLSKLIVAIGILLVAYSSFAWYCFSQYTTEHYSATGIFKENLLE